MKHLTETGLHIMRARELMNSPNKWCKTRSHCIRGGTIRRCISGAIEDTSKGEGPFNAALLAIDVALDPNYEGTYIDYNDDVDTTHQDVMDLMLKAALAAE